MVQGFKYIRSTNVEPWNSDIKQETFPGPTVVTDGDIRGILVSDQNSCDWLLFPQNLSKTRSIPSGVCKYAYYEGYMTDQIADAAGSCSMLPRHKNGVVDPELKVDIFQQNPMLYYWLRRRFTAPPIFVWWISLSSLFKLLLIPKVNAHEAPKRDMIYSDIHVWSECIHDWRERWDLRSPSPAYVTTSIL
jgi:hypothetical protein